MSGILLVLRILVLSAIAGCTAGSASDAPAPATNPHVDPRAGLDRHWAVRRDDAERLLATADFEIVEQAGAGAGVTGAYKLLLRFPDENTDLHVKWKPMPAGDLDSWNNSPRKELATYRVQFWFLDDDELIVPATVVRCIPLDAYRRVDPSASATLPGTSCVLGVFSLWLDNVRVPEVVHEDSRFFVDNAYAHHMANFNLLTYAIDHRDGRAGNFLVSSDASNRRIFAVDNGISFGPVIYNYFVPNWNGIRVPALRRESVEKLRDLRAVDIQALGVVVELRAGEDGVLRTVAAGPNLGPASGSRIRHGIVQLGLDDDEIEELQERIEELLEDVDDGNVMVY